MICSKGGKNEKTKIFYALEQRKPSKKIQDGKKKNTSEKIQEVFMKYVKGNKRIRKTQNIKRQGNSKHKKVYKVSRGGIRL